MIQRFQIEDLVLQDASGVVFRTLDSETNQLVAVRRFFPFGPGGGGLSVDEQAAYTIAIGRLIGVTHPALCTVIGGGCDPVDGMPYIATEWLEGTPLKTYVDAKPLSPENATRLILEALDVCQLLSETLGEEVVWVETGLHTILVCEATTGRGFTFGISPLKGLGKHHGQRGLDGLVGLTEDVMGWRGEAVDDQAAGGLGAWLKWLRGASKTTTLHETREMLAASLNVEPPVPAQTSPIKRPMELAPVVIIKQRKLPNKFPWLLGATVLLLASLGAGGFLYFRYLKHPVPSVELAASKADIVRSEITPPVPVANPPATAAPQPAANKPSSLRADGIYTIANGDLLLAQKGEVTLEGVLAEISYSRGRKLMYLNFSKNPPASEPCGVITTKGASAGLQEAQITPLIGKKIWLRGKVNNQGPSKAQRPHIVIESPPQIIQMPK